MTRLLDTPAKSRRTHLALFAWVLLVLVLAFGAWTHIRSVNAALTDARADWIVVSAAIEGMDPWADLRDLGARLGTQYLPVGDVELGEFFRAHPRTPGALLLLTPLSAFGPDAAYPLMVVLTSVAAALASLFALTKHRSMPLGAMSVVAIALAGSGAYLSALEFGTQSVFILLLISATWLLTRDGDSIGGGIALGVAATLKLFPLLFIIPLLAYKRLRAVVAAGLTVVILNAAGVLVLDLDPGRVFGLLDAADEWLVASFNGSLAMPLAAVGLNPALASLVVSAVAVIVALGSVRRGWSFDFTVAVLIVVSVLCAPLAWPHYDVLLFAVVAYIISRRGTPNQIVWWMVGFFVGLQLLSPAINSVLGSPSFSTLGITSILGKLVLLGALAGLNSSGSSASGAGESQDSVVVLAGP